MSHRIALAALALASCTEPEVARFSALGPLVGDAGRSSFRFGAATAATQIEDHNPNTDWWIFTLPEAEGGLGRGVPVGEASRGHTLALEDAARVAELGLDAYRFSVEWARVEPRRDEIDLAALSHYGAALDALVARGVRPMITVHHFSNPRWVDDPRAIDCPGGPRDDNLCGFGHPVGGPLVVEELAEHARLLAARYGDRVDEWITVNEPLTYLIAAYGAGAFPPGKRYIFDLLDDFVPVLRDYIAAHAAIYRAIREADTIDADGDGVAAAIGLSLSVGDWVPAKNNQLSRDPLDRDARDRLERVYHELVVDAARLGRFDVDLDGDYETEMPGWRDTIDFLGVQYYFRSGVTGTDGVIPTLSLSPCLEGLDLGACVPPRDPSFCVPAMGYETDTAGLLDALRSLAARWPDLPLLVTEAGIATEVGARRAENVVRVLEKLALARAEGIDLRGYYHWSLVDNFEWALGFGPRFGLFRLEADGRRVATEGAEVYAAIARARALSPAQVARYGGDGPMTPEPGGGLRPRGTCTY